MKILVCAFAFDEGEKIKRVIGRTLAARKKSKYKYDFMVADDGSKDRSLDDIPSDVILLRNKKNMGIGFMMKRVFQYCVDNNYDIIVAMSGNDKDEPKEIDDLLSPIIKSGYHFVQGSRFLGNYGNMPTYRVIATKIVHPLLCGIAARKMLTESSNGFRAFKVDILKDENINWNQDWLNQYQLEPYLLIKSIRCGYKHMEVPCTKIYPTKKTTKMKPFISWWNMVEAPIYLMFGIKK
jgi:glycosyltransferase involved in cell wall biosynthesis